MTRPHITIAGKRRFIFFQPAAPYPVSSTPRCPSLNQACNKSSRGGRLDGKIKDYVRTFCFLNLGSPQTPAVLIVVDNIETARSEFTKQWQVNTLKPPQPTADGVVLQNSDFGKTGRVHLQMLLPPPANRTMQIVSGHAANSVAGRYFAPPKPDRPEANGHRIVFSPADRQAKEVFLTVLSMCAQDTPALPLELTTFPETFVLACADRIVVLSRTGKLLQSAFQFDIQGAGKDQLLLVAGLAPGRWSITDRAGKVRLHTRVEAGRNTAFWRVPGGSYRIRRDAS
jgi:heparin/heparan-sulfate lyase